MTIETSREYFNALEIILKHDCKSLERKLVPDKDIHYSKNDVLLVSMEIKKMESNRNYYLEKIEKIREESSCHDLCFKYELEIYKICSDKIKSFLDNLK